jgi:hypothetical protein
MQTCNCSPSSSATTRKPLGVEELLALAVVLEAGLAALVSRVRFDRR